MDDEIAELFLDEAEVPTAMLKAAIRKHTLSIEITPVLCGSAFKNKGVQPLLDAVLDYLPSPLEVKPIEGTHVLRGGDDGEPIVLQPDDADPFSALAFKIMADPFVGKLTYFRVYSGKLSAGSKILNVSTGRTERVGRLLVMHANDREEVDAVYAGDIAAAVGIKQITTGDTLSAIDRPVRLENIDFPEPVIKVAVEPKTKIDQEKMSVALGRLAEEDPTFQVQTNEETGQIEISGMGELHLEILVDRMKREYGVEANVGRPQVSYRETIRGTAHKVEGRFVKQTGGSGQFGIVYIDIEPNVGEGFEFVSKIKGGSVPSEFIPAVAKGVEEALVTGVKAGYPMVDVKVTLIDGKYHDTDSSEIAFKVAGSLALKEAARRAKPVLLEPIFAVEVVTPEEFLGQVIGDLSSRRGRVEGQEQRGNALAVTGEGPAERDVRLRDRPALQHAGPRELDDAVRPLRRGSAEHRREGRRAPHGGARPRLSTVRRKPHAGAEVRASCPEPRRFDSFIQFIDRRRGANRKWEKRSSSATSRTSTSARSVISTTARRR